jgi:TadE-like protein
MVLPHYKQKGAVLIELAFILPLLIFLTVGGIALSFWTRYKLIATNYAASGGQMLYRECRFLEHTDVPNCLIRVKALLKTASIQAGHSADFILSWYQATSSIPPFSPELKSQVLGDTFARSSKISVADFNGLGRSRAATDFFKKHGQAWVCEALVESPIKYDFIGGIAYAKMVN